VHPLLVNAVEIAEHVLFPAALEVDRAERVPDSHFAALAAGGLYQLAVPSAAVPPGTLTDVAETLAAGCLATAFVWIQHQGLVRALAESKSDELRAAWLADLCAGRKRGGLALGSVRPGPQRLTARRTSSGWQLDGEAPWVTGWGLVHALRVLAVSEEGEAIGVVLPAEPVRTIQVTPRRLVAANASCSVQLRFEAHLVPFEQTLSRVPYVPSSAHDGGGRLNGSLALGVSRRCCQLLGPSELDAQLDARRRQLDLATPETLAPARADAVELALRASAALVVASGSQSITELQHPQRLAREAPFLSVFGSRPAVPPAFLARLCQPT